MLAHSDAFSGDEEVCSRGSARRGDDGNSLQYVFKYPQLHNFKSHHF